MVGKGIRARIVRGALVVAVAMTAGPVARAGEDFAARLQATWRGDLLRAMSGGGAPAPRVSPASDAAGGCDGVKNGGFGFHTNQGKDPWWQVDLGGRVAIGRVVVYNRCTVSERAAKLRVLLSEDGKAFTRVYRHNGTVFRGATDNKPLVVELGGRAGRFVRVQLPGMTWLHLDEIEVYAPGEAKKNLALRRPANQSTASNWSTGRPIRRRKSPAVSVPRAKYASAVTDALANGSLLAADLAKAGVDTAAFDRARDEIAGALKRLGNDSPDLKTYALYFRARRAVRELALANPLLADGACDKLLVVRRAAKNLALPANWESNSSLRPAGYDNEIAVLGDLRSGGTLRTLFRPEGGRFVGDVDLHFDADKMLFSMPDEKGRWCVYELDADGKNLRPMKLIDQPDVGNYDACYLPDGNIIFNSTAPFIGVPCVRGHSHVTNLYLWTPADDRIRRLAFDQDHNWCPTVLNNGRVMYLRWEYSDIPHSNSRILFHMDPDGTKQMELYGSNSYWPNGIFYARPIPGHPTKVVGIVTGHHGVRRMGELVIFDPARGGQEADGVIQRIGQRGEVVEPIVRDRLVNASWPRYLHPWPLSEKYILAPCKATSTAPWGLYLVDVFDNRVLLAECDGSALLEPIPFRRRPRPPVLAGKVDLKRTDAVVYLADVYRGGGLAGVPRGTVRSLRLFTYHYSYHGTGGLLGVIGADGPWDIKRVLGTVPVEPDGSAVFRIPANVPIAVQPLDERGQALQIMRSWFVGMPGEVVSCVGCHERQTETPNVAISRALRRRPSEIRPWYGPVRGFAFAREVQPVLDRHCVGCHSPAAGARFDPRTMGDLRGVGVQGWRSKHSGNGGGDSGKFSVGYHELARYVRRPGIESNIHLLTPMEFHAETTELVQLLRKGHHGVRLDAEAWDRLVTWIDLNAPYHGTWTEIVGTRRVARQARRRRELLKRYAGVDVDDEAVPAPPGKVEPIVPPQPPAPAGAPPARAGWPFDPAEARRRQGPDGQTARTIDLGEGIRLDLVRIPAGEFVMGSRAGHRDERPMSRVRIARDFWIGRCEVTNEQYARFDPLHDSRVESKHGYQFGIHGYRVNGPRQPVVRVSWRRAMAFARWLTDRARGKGLSFSLPTEAQWEYACRAGSDAPFHYGSRDVDFSKLANLGDAKLAEFASNPYTTDQPMKTPNRFDDWLPKDARFNDGSLVSADVGSYRPNPWGLHDAHGNVAEWTRSLYRPYPYAAGDGRNDPAAAGRRVVRGGSWYDRPRRCRSAFRLSYRPYHGVYNVGFRVVAAGPVQAVAATGRSARR